ncbi:MAG: hypothetical protein ACTHNA_08015 [Sphingopyxis terrae]|uniref:hypothetical protein n=1 Tax=Sphingopyxis terrae TaxID=33052 RepID=UPI003F808EEB
MKISADSYPTMRAWLATVAPYLFPDVPADADPVRALDRIAETSMSNARRGLSMAIGDIVEMTDSWPSREIMSLDAELATIGLPTLSAMRAQCSKAVRAILRRGRIKNEAEYYLIRNAVDIDPERSKALFDLLATWDHPETD